MEELTSTVRQNAENAKQANQTGGRRLRGRRQGRPGVDQVVQTMSSINDSSKKIAGHHQRDRGIAFQDQHSGAERRGGSSARRRTGPAASQWCNRSADAWPQKVRRRRKRSRT